MIKIGKEPFTLATSREAKKSAAIGNGSCTSAQAFKQHELISYSTGVPRNKAYQARCSDVHHWLRYQGSTRPHSNDCTTNAA